MKQYTIHYIIEFMKQIACICLELYVMCGMPLTESISVYYLFCRSHLILSIKNCSAQ